MENQNKFFIDASSDEHLATIREDADRIKRAAIENEEEFSDYEDEERRAKKGKPKKHSKRIYSPFLRSLIAKYSPDHTCNEEADTTCLLQYVKDFIPQYGAKYTDLKLFKEQLIRIEKVVSHLVNTNYVRNYFTEYTGAFRAYLVPKGEKFYKPWLDLVSEHLHGEKKRVLVYLKQQDASRLAKLQDGFQENWADADHAVRELFRYAEEGKDKKYGAATILALELCVGSRKTAFLDPNVKFYTWDEWKTTHSSENRNELGLQEIGTNELSLELKDLSDNKFTSSVIVQVGILKDAKNKIQKHMAEEDRDDPRFIVKPCLIYTAEYLVTKIRAFREKYNITRETFTTRKKVGNSWGTRLFHPLLETYFKNSYEKAKSKGWQIGSHHMRRIYVMATIHFFKDSAEMASGKVLAQSVWMALVLGHMGSVATTISYSNCKLIFTPPHEVFQSPPLELIKQLAQQVFDMQETIDKLQKQANEAAKLQEQVDDLTQRVAASEATSHVTFVLKDKSVVTVEKNKKHNYKDEQDKLNTMQKSADLLTQHKVPVNVTNLGKMGFGRGLVTEFFKSKNQAQDEPLEEVKEQKQEQAQAQVSSNIPPPHQEEQIPEQKQAKRQKTQHKANKEPRTYSGKGYHKLRPNEKIISEKEGSTAEANHIRKVRDKKKYGEQVFEEGDCEGQIVKDVPLAPKVTRDLIECDD